MKIIITSVFLSLSLLSFGQEKLDLLIGKWQYEDLHQKDKLDSSKITMLNELFGTMNLQFDADGLFQATIMGKSEQGNWTTEKNNILKLASDKGNVFELEVLELTGKHLTIKLRDNAFVMKKLNMTETAVLKETESPYILSSATTEQIAKTWHLESKETLKKESKEVQEAFDASLEGSYITFKKKGKLEAVIFGVKEKGKWEFGEGNTTIITTGEAGQKVWSIIAISDNSITLSKGKSKEKWVFKAGK